MSKLILISAAFALVGSACTQQNTDLSFKNDREAETLNSEEKQDSLADNPKGSFINPPEDEPYQAGQAPIVEDETTEAEQAGELGSREVPFRPVPPVKEPADADTAAGRTPIGTYTPPREIE